MTSGLIVPSEPVPYRIDIVDPPQDALDRLVQMGALDVESVADGIAAIIPDGVMPDTPHEAEAAAPDTAARPAPTPKVRPHIEKRRTTRR